MPTISERLEDVFKWIESRDLRVGELWLHPRDIDDLNQESPAGWDRVASFVVERWHADSKGALLTGFLWGAEVLTPTAEPCPIVRNHVIALPTGLHVRILDGTGAQPF